MPATESYKHNLKKVHVVFALSSIGLLAVTLWMMEADHAREWTGYQRTFEDIQSRQLIAENNELLKNPRYQTTKEDLDREKDAAQKVLDSKKHEEDKITAALAEADRVFDKSSREVRNVRAYRDKARADYDLAVRDQLPQAELDKKQQDFAAKQAEVDKAERENQDLQTARDKAQSQLKELTKNEDDAVVALAKLNGDLELRDKALAKLEPTGFSAFKKRIMEWPIIDGFNSPLKITQDWLPKLTIQLGMARTARFDRCRTCHGAIDRVEAGNFASFPFGEVKTASVSDWVLQKKFPQPFATHPRPELYLTSHSPHVLEKFGCTICHDGQGSGTSFRDASHTANDPYIYEQWHAEHHYDSNHFWEYPMQPERLRESTCIKCHHTVVELGIHPQYGASAPKLFRGYNLIKEYGCFGCHEIQGFDGTRPIGPDLRLEPSTEAEAARIAADPTQIAGTLRKVGPSLRHIKTKLTDEFVRYWVQEPKRFRPTTRMPQFFHNSNQDDPLAGRYQPIELAGIAHYLLASSEPLDLIKPDPEYKPDAKRGKDLFTKRGCLACHSHEAVPNSHADFGPDLSKVHSKIQPGDEGFHWVYSWIRDPQRYHKRSRMPNLFVEPYTEGKTQIDPAADIAAFLLEKGPEKFTPPNVDEKTLDELTLLFLSKTLKIDDANDVVHPTDNNPKTRHRYPLPKSEVKGDEIELIAADLSKPISDKEWYAMRLNYVGRKSISRYGCYGCHDIPNFETARPIGTTLQDWGRKDTSRLAPEHIEEYLLEHGEPNGGSTHERIVTAMKAARAGGTATGEFKGNQAETEMRAAYYYNDLMHHGRSGFLWQKLRDPRSYDHLKVATKGYDERLRMPKFPFNEEEIEAISTFVLGLVADPPAKEYIYQPEGPAKARIEGERLIDRYNCVGCHVIQLPEITYAVDPKDLTATAVTPSDHPAGVELLLKLKPPEKGETGGKMTVKTDAGEKELPVVRFRGLLNSRPEADAPPEEREYTYDLWATLEVGGKKLFPGSRMLVSASRLVPGASVNDGYSVPPRGGVFAEWLVESLMASQKIVRPVAWQMAPPPLYKEGIKVQTPWLYQFLRDPYRLRHTTVLRMPRFNMSSEEAQTLANYFAAVDDEPFPYQQIPERKPEYLEAKEEQLKRYLKKTHYLAESWKVLNAPLCIKCHSVGGREVKIGDPAKDIRGPNLEFAADRLRPEWTMLWLYKPAWITPYTSMPQPLPKDAKNFEQLFGGDAGVQTIAIRDALMNYHRLMEQEGKALADSPAPKASKISAAPGSGGNE